MKQKTTKKPAMCLNSTSVRFIKRTKANILEQSDQPNSYLTEESIQVTDFQR